MLPNDTVALSKHIVSFGTAKRKRNERSLLAVIFIPIFKEENVMKRPNGTGTVVKLSGKRRKPYSPRITVGKTISASGNVTTKYKYLGYFSTAREAQDYLDRYNGTEDQQQKIKMTSVKDNPTFETVYHETLNYLENRKREYSSSTYKALNSAFNNLYCLHPIKFKNIDYELLQNAISQNNKLSKSSLNNIHNLLKKMYRLAIKKGYVEKDISAQCDYDYSNPDEEIHTPFSREEITKIYNAPSCPERDMLLILLYTGIRSEEFLIIETQNVHLDEHYFITGVKTSAGKSRIIPIHDKIMPIMQAHYNKKSFYFWNIGKSQRIYQTLRYRFNKYMNEMNMEHLPHDTRHSTATYLHECGIDDMYIKLILGHHIEDITQRVYIHTKPEILVHEINKLDI